MIIPGTKLGPYAIVEQIGAGGMGEVYRATDTRLDRTVAIKILPESMATDEARRERFEREARTVSSLNHPNICTLYDVGEQDGIHYLVMELVEGQTLDQRLNQGRLPMGAALEYAIQIADALAAAHRQGIVHRDLKPGNIMVTPSGVKLLDFGLAKWSHEDAFQSPLSQIATAASRPLTSEGTILGTLQYMAPEQLEGGEADARSDIFAFGAVVYELVTGRKAFEGKSQASLIGAIMNSEPASMTDLAEAPPFLDHLIRRCLAKSPADRWQSVADVAGELRWIQTFGVARSEVDSPSSTTSSRSFRMGAALVAVLLLAAGLGAGRFLFAPPPAEELRFGIPLVGPPSMRLTFSAGNRPLAVSPNGRDVVYEAVSNGTVRLYIHTLGTGTSRPLPESEGGLLPFWSADGRSIAFFAENQLKRFDLATDSVRSIAAAPGPRGGAWNDSGQILFGPSRPGGPLFSMSDEGGPLVQESEVAGAEEHLSPRFLPDGEGYLFYVEGRTEGNGIYAGRLGDPESVFLLDADGPGEYLAPGYLLFVRDGTLLAGPFDWSTFSLGEGRWTIADDVVADSVAASASGAVAFMHGSGSAGARLVAFDPATGVAEPVGEAIPGNNPALSPDGTRLAMDIAGEANRQVWLQDMVGGRTATPFQGAGSNESNGIWSPDGDFLVMTLFPTDAVSSLEVRRVDGSGDGHRLVASQGIVVASDWTAPEGSRRQYVLYREGSAEGYNLWAVALDDDLNVDGDPIPVAVSPAIERDGAFSPNGNWVAYQSDKTGGYHIYARTFPASGPEIQISGPEGGAQVRWAPDGSAVYYLALDGRLMSVALDPAASDLDPGPPVPLIATDLLAVPGNAFRQQFVVVPDGRILMNDLPETTDAMITMILNWTPGDD